MDLFRFYFQTTAREAGVCVATAGIDYIIFNVCGNHKQRIIVSAHIESVTLADGKELRAVMRAYDLTPGVGLETGLLYVLAARTVGLGYEFD